MTPRVVSNSRLGKIDIMPASHRPLVERFDVREFPTFKIFHNGVEVLGPHLSSADDAAEIVEYLITAKANAVGTSACILVFCRGQ